MAVKRGLQPRPIQWISARMHRAQERKIIGVRLRARKKYLDL